MFKYLSSNAMWHRRILNSKIHIFSNFLLTCLTVLHQFKIYLAPYVMSGIKILFYFQYNQYSIYKNRLIDVCLVCTSAWQDANFFSSTAIWGQVFRTFFDAFEWRDMPHCVCRLIVQSQSISGFTYCSR